MPEHPWLASLAVAVRRERDAQEAELRRRLALPWVERVATGASWPALRLRQVDEAPRGTDLVLAGEIHDGIGPGDRVTVAPLGRPDAGVEGTVEELDPPVVRILDAPPVAPGAPVAVSLRFDSTPFDRMLKGLDAADAHRSRLKQVLLGDEDWGTPTEHKLPELDEAQLRAANAALGAEVLALIHGPPGTGKTWLLARILVELVARGEKPLALADSNAAVDHLALAAAGRGLRVLRLGREARIGPAARHLGLDKAMEEGHHAGALKSLDKAIQRADGGERAQLRAERRELVKEAERACRERADVIACTLSFLAGSSLTGSVAVVDEATQATEAAVWAAVPRVKRLILCGDPEQLGPVVLSRPSPLETPMINRLRERNPTTMLEVQRRMSAPIAELVQGVYGPAYRPAPEVAERRLRDLPGVSPEDPLTGMSRLWIDTAGMDGEATDPVRQSLYNEAEVEVVVKVVERLRAAGVQDLAVIAPYSAQVARLRARLPGVEVATVNAFQGRERDAIICSFVRSNERGELGFVADRRRLVVSVTRPRRLLVVVGDSATLCGNDDFSKLFTAFGEDVQSAWDW